jgi:hypothetical protein
VGRLRHLKLCESANQVVGPMGRLRHLKPLPSCQPSGLRQAL